MSVYYDTPMWDWITVYQPIQIQGFDSLPGMSFLYSLYFLLDLKGPFLKKHRFSTDPVLLLVVVVV